jgi:putative ABC transport system permease protein
MKLFSLAKIAFRNTIKNRRRALFTTFAVGLGFVGYSLIEGYFTNVYRTLEDQAVVGERLGHMVITRKDFYRFGASDPEKYSFDAAATGKISDLLAKRDDVALISPRLGVSGLVSNGESSRIFIGEAIEPRDLKALRGEKYADLPGMLREDAPNSGVFGSKLAEYLAAKAGDDVVLMVSTIGGMVNASDVTIGEAANTGSTATDDKFVLLPLAYARDLLAYEGADRIVVKLKDGAQTDAVRTELIAALGAAGIDAEIKTWKEVSQYYNQVKGLFDMMSFFFALVVALVVMATVTNTIGMSISERTRETGTMRAFGMQSRTINTMYMLEGGIITLLGAFGGTLVTLLIVLGINSADITYTPPDASAETALELTLLPENLIGTAITLFVVGAISAYFISRRASRANIVESLTHV